MRNLHFFRKLKSIGGVLKKIESKALYIFENYNLEKLFPLRNEVQFGKKKTVFIHFNKKLCQKDIITFLEAANVPENMRTEAQVSTVSNGNQMICSDKKLWLQVKATSSFLEVKHENYQQHLLGEGSVKNSLLGYHIFYRELTEEQFSRNV